MRRLFHERLEDRRLLTADLNLDFTASLGGIGDQAIIDVVADEEGFLYLVGKTEDGNLPLLGGAGSETGNDVFVAKYDTLRRDVVFAKRIGGTNADYGSAISVDTAGQITISGYTHSDDFPWVNPRRQPHLTPADSLKQSTEGFVARISADGDSLLFVTPIGGSSDDAIRDHAITPTGEIVIVGNTDSLDYPTTPGAFQEQAAESVLYGSQDAAATWQPASKGLNNVAVRDIAIDPTNESIVYAAFDSAFSLHKLELSGSTSAYGVNKSLDGGQTWAATGGVNSGLKDQTVTRVLVNPETPQIVYAGTDGQSVWKSTDGAATWNQAGAALQNPFVRDLEMSPSDPDVLYVATHNRGDLLRTVDGGATWNSIALPYNVGFIIDIELDAGDPSTIYLSLGQGVLKSVDAGATWQEVASAFAAQDTMGFWTDPVNSQVVYMSKERQFGGAGDAGLLKSIDGGDTWSTINNGLPLQSVTALAIDPTDSAIVYAAAWDEVYKSTDGGANWSLADGLPEKRLTTLAVSGDTVLAGSLRTYGDTFVTVLTNDGSQILASTFLGSEGHDNAVAVTTDASGIYVTGDLQSAVPLTRGTPSVIPLVNVSTSVMKLNRDLADLSYRFFLDTVPSFPATASEIAVDQRGQAYVVGSQSGDAVTWKLANDGSSVLYSTSIGSSASDYGRGIAVDHMGYAYVTGEQDWDGVGLPEVLPIQPSGFGGGENDAFVAQLDPEGRVTMSSSLGGSGLDYGSAVTVSSAGDIYFVGRTDDIGWISDPHEPSQASSNDEGFIANVSVEPYTQLPANYEQQLRDYAAVTARYFMSDQSNNLQVGFPHSWFGTGPFRDCSGVGQCNEADWELNRGYGSYTVINEVTLRLNVLAIAPRMEWDAHLPEAIRYERTWGQVTTGLQTLRSLQTSGNSEQYADGAFYRFYLTADNTPAAEDLSVAEIRRVTHEQSADDNALSYLNLLQLKGLAQSANSGVQQQDSETIAALIDQILSDMDLCRFIHNERILHSRTDGQPTVDQQTQTIQYWDRISAEGSLILAAMLASEQITVSDFQALALTLENYPVAWTTDGGQQISVKMPSYHSAGFMHSLRPIHGMPVTDSELAGLTYYRESTIPIMQTQIAFADYQGYQALGSQVMSQEFNGHTLVDQAAHPGTQARFPGNEIDEMPTPSDTLARATGPHAMIIPLARYRDMDPRDVDWLFQSLDAFDDQFFHTDGAAFGWEATIPWDPQDTTFTWTASDNKLKYADNGRPYEALNAAYIALAAYDVLNPEAPLASLNARADLIGDAARYFDASVGTTFDFGDAPDDSLSASDYPTLRASDGAAHIVVPGVYLGAAVDGERDGYPTASASGDDQQIPGDDEDGVAFAPRLVRGEDAVFTVTASTDGLLNAWIDWNGDGDWADAEEQIFSDRPLTPGDNLLSVPVPTSATLTALDEPTFARFRFSTEGRLSFAGLAPDGEVEDYPVLINEPTVLAIASANANNAEGDRGSTPFTFTVTRTGYTLQSSSVQYVVVGNGRNTVDADDFGGVLPSGTVTFAPGEASQTISVQVRGDLDVEPDEEFTIALSDPAGGELGTREAMGTIINDDTILTLAATGGPQAEGNADTTPFRFSVTRTGDAMKASTVQYAVTGSGVHPADADDFSGTLPSGSVMFGIGVISQTITVQVTGDLATEADEQFLVTLSNPTGGQLGTDTAEGTILNDDTTLAISPSSTVRTEGDSGTELLTFTVTRTGVTTGTSRVEYAVAGSGSNPADTVDFGGSLPRGIVEFVAGETTHTITVAIIGDDLVELDEGFTVTLFNALGTQILVAAADGMIQNDDLLLIDVTVSLADTHGNPLPSDKPIAIGRDFRIYVHAQDRRTYGLDIGVLSTFVDVTYDETMFSITGIVPLFEESTMGSIDAAAGVVEEVGGVTSAQVTTRNPQPVFYLEATPVASGLTTVGTNVGESVLSENQLAGIVGDLRHQTQFGSLQVVIGESWQNPRNRYDVSDNGYVTPEDLLIMIDRLNTRVGDAELPAPPASPPPYYDVNNDGYCTTLDVLETLNYLNIHSREASGEGEGQVADGGTLRSTHVVGENTLSELSRPMSSAIVRLDASWQGIVQREPTPASRVQRHARLVALACPSPLPELVAAKTRLTQESWNSESGSARAALPPTIIDAFDLDELLNETLGGVDLDALFQR